MPAEAGGPAPPRPDITFAYGAAAGLAGDLLLGDPRRGHPVAVFGRAAAAVERGLWHGQGRGPAGGGESVHQVEGVLLDGAGADPVGY
ncbi:hypothetical protein AB0I99_23050, partial [Streptomyces spongiicola]